MDLTGSIIRRIHLWLGLASGLIVWIVSISGCLYVFKDDLSAVCYRDAFFVDRAAGTPLPITVLMQKARAALGDSSAISAVTTYKDRERTWSFSTYKAGKTTALTFFGEDTDSRSAFIDPYTGDVKAVIVNTREFFFVVKMLHSRLWLRADLGKPIVSAATLIFVVLLVSGLVLWWPGRKGSKIQRSFTLNFKASAKRLTYDLHNVLGYYSLSVALIIALTGLVMAYGWMYRFEYWIANPLNRPRATEQPLNLQPPLLAADAADSAMHRVREAYPNASTIVIYPPSSTDSTVYMYANMHPGALYEFNLFTFNWYTGKAISKTLYEQKNAGEKFTLMNYDIHTGAVLGWMGKLLAFLAALISASLPITGCMMWLNKRKKALREH